MAGKAGRVRTEIAVASATSQCTECWKPDPDIKGEEIFFLVDGSSARGICRACARKIAREDGFIDEKRDTLVIKEEEKPSHDPVNRPSHYNSHPSGVECIEITRHYSCMVGSAIKYLWRAGLKKSQYAFAVDPKKVNLKDLEELYDKRLQPGSFIKIDATTQPSDAIKLLGDYSKEEEIEDLNKALFCIMEEINRLGGTVTAKPRQE